MSKFFLKCLQIVKKLSWQGYQGFFRLLCEYPKFSALMPKMLQNLSLLHEMVALTVFAFTIFSYIVGYFQVLVWTAACLELVKEFKIIGNLMIESNVDELKKDLKSKKETISLRVKNLEGQEKKLREKAESLQKEVMGVIKEKEGK